MEQQGGAVALRVVEVQQGHGGCPRRGSRTESGRGAGRWWLWPVIRVTEDEDLAGDEGTGRRRLSWCLMCTCMRRYWKERGGGESGAGALGGERRETREDGIEQRDPVGARVRRVGVPARE